MQEQTTDSQLLKSKPHFEILDGLTTRNSNRIFISGSAGTGKTILLNRLKERMNFQPQVKMEVWLFGL